MIKKKDILNFFEKGIDTNTRFTDSFIHSFVLQLQFIDSDTINEQMATEWIQVIEDILEIMNPKYTSDTLFFNNLKKFLEKESNK